MASEGTTEKIKYKESRVLVRATAFSLRNRKGKLNFRWASNKDLKIKDVKALVNKIETSIQNILENHQILNAD